MFGIRYIKFPPTTWVIHSQNGAPVRQGRGLAFFYFAPRSSIVAIPMESNDLPFVFNQTTGDFQTVTIQGQLTYRVADPQKLAELLDFSVDPRGMARTGDPGKVGQRLVNESQSSSSAFLETVGLREALKSQNEVAAAITQGLSTSRTVQMLGIEPLGVSIVSIAATPEMARALEAEAREGLQQEADRAIYARRNYAVEQERLIRENELNTEIAVEQKQRTIRETKMGADIAVEEQRKALIDLRTDNEKKEADARAYATGAMLEPLKGADWRLLSVLGNGSLDPRMLIADSFSRLADNAGRIGTLNISPELLASLLGDRGK